jgi:hypothetical protein
MSNDLVTVMSTSILKYQPPLSIPAALGLMVSSRPPLPPRGRSLFPRESYRRRVIIQNLVGTIIRGMLADRAPPPPLPPFAACQPVPAAAL